MESPGQHRKRKSRDSDIFEVSERDLSPEPEGKIENEPASKVMKCTDADVSDSPLKDEQLNLEISNITSGEVDKSEELGQTASDVQLIDETINITQNSSEIHENNPVEDDFECGELKDSLQDSTVLDATPCISITFADTSIADKYKQKFCKFIQTFVELEISLENDTTINVLRNPNLNPSEWVVLDNTIDLLGSNESLKETLDNGIVGTVKKQKKKKKQNLFVVDTQPILNTKEVKLKYSTKFVINDHDDKNKISSSTTTCFNCEKQHALIDCPEPRDFSRITFNRQKFNAKNKVARYHLETDQKYGHLQPGQISSELRKALGLKKHQIPSYVYYMRVKGYPPGWLEEAKHKQSDLNMFDIDGKCVQNIIKSKTRGLDPEKVINYPGFNVPLKEDCKDEFYLHDVPPYSEDFSKENMLRYFEQNCVNEEDNHQTQDMDIDTTNELSEIEIEDRINVTDDVQKENSNDVPSLSLVDLERKKNTLLAELQKSNEVAPWDFEGPEDSNSLSNECANNKDVKPPVTESEEPEVKKEEDQDESNLNTEALKKGEDVNNTLKNIMISTYGTPILKSSSPYNKLPQLANFTKGVSAVIDFENLPNSTGKYEQMSKVLQKVRDKLKVMDKN